MPTSRRDFLKSSIAAGGVMAAVQRDWGRVLGYAALSSLGFVLLAFGLGGSQGLGLSRIQPAIGHGRRPLASRSGHRSNRTIGRWR